MVGYLGAPGAMISSNTHMVLEDGHESLSSPWFVAGYGLAVVAAGLWCRPGPGPAALDLATLPDPAVLSDLAVLPDPVADPDS